MSHHMISAVNASVDRLN